MPSRKLNEKPYTGILSEPLPTYIALNRPADEDLQALIDIKLKALFAHFGLDATDAFGGGPRMAAAWANLVWHLARAHVPGFVGVPRGRGRLATRKHDDVSLVMRVELLTRRDGLSVRKAIKYISDNNLVLGKEEALLKRYNRAKFGFKPIAQLFDNVVATLGEDSFCQVMDKSFFEDRKDTILSSDQAHD